jgi:putative membrane protein
MNPPTPPAVVQNVAPVPLSRPPSTLPALQGIDKTFALTALAANRAEILMARLALQRSNVNEVRGFAQKMLAEHGALAESMGAALRRAAGSAEPRELSGPDALTYRRLQVVPDADFAQQYLIAQVGAHLATSSAFQTEADDGADPQLKALARRWLPTIQAHLQLALFLTGSIGGASPFKQH